MVINARQLARRVEVGREVDWALVQGAAFEGYPVVRRRLDPLGEHSPVPVAVRRGRSAVGQAGCVVSFVGFLSPVVGVGAALLTFGGSRYGTGPAEPQPGTWLPVAGVAFGVTVVTVAVLLRSWWAEGRPRDGLAWGYPLGAALLAVGSAVAGAHTGRAAHMSTWPAWTGVIAAAAGVSALAFLIALLASRPPLPADLPYASPGRIRRAREATSRLTLDQRAAVAADLRAALDALEERGVITAATATRARDAELGLLPEAMAPTPAPDGSPERAT